MNRSHFRWRIERNTFDREHGLALVWSHKYLGGTYGETGRNMMATVRLTLLSQTWELIASWKEHE